MVNVTKQDWFDSWNKRFFEEGERGIIVFIEETEENKLLNKEILDFFDKEKDIPVLIVDALEFKFLRKVIRKHFGLNGFPNICAVKGNEFTDYYYYRNYNRTHPGTISDDLEYFVEEFKEEN